VKAAEYRWARGEGRGVLEECCPRGGGRGEGLSRIAAFIPPITPHHTRRLAPTNLTPRASQLLKSFFTNWGGAWGKRARQRPGDCKRWSQESLVAIPSSGHATHAWLVRALPRGARWRQPMSHAVRARVPSGIWPCVFQRAMAIIEALALPSCRTGPALRCLRSRRRRPTQRWRACCPPPPAAPATEWQR